MSKIYWFVEPLLVLSLRQKDLKKGKYIVH